MSLWGALYVGTSGLKTSQNALNTVAHNLANADTKGYTRQQVLQADQRYTTLSKSESAISYQQVGPSAANPGAECFIRFLPR